MTKIGKHNLPNKLIYLPNEDKAFHESWTAGRSPLNIPHPSRYCICSVPNRGKTNVVKNLILHQNPPFQEVFVIHCDPDYTREYDDIDNCHLIGEIPPPDSWEGVKKTLVVIDDLDLKGLNKAHKKNLDRLFGYVSTHKNISVICCQQDPYSIPPIVRRCSNVFVLWKGVDLDSFNSLAKKVGMKKDEFKSIFNKFKDLRDSLWIDTTNNSPYPLRCNGFIPIKRKEENE